MKIKHLKLDCANLDELKYFYTKKFRFQILEESPGELTLQFGDSLLTLTRNRLKTPYYHFAFNIPYGSMDVALKWVKKKIPVLSTEDGEIQDFSSWKAKSFYFLDPAGNIVEFIGRERYDDSGTDSFSENRILNISEIGLPVSDVNAAFKQINEKCRVEKFDCTRDTFCAVGDDEGLFIMVDKSEKSWFPTEIPARAYPLEVNYKVGQRLFYLTYHGGEIDITETEKKNA